MALITVLGLTGACGTPDPQPTTDTEPGAEVSSTADDGVREALRETLSRSASLADSVEGILRPVALLRPAEEQALRQFGNATHLTRARALGARPANDAEIDALRDEGRLVPLGDSTRFWVTRRMRANRALVTPDARALLELVGERFHDRLAEMGLPPYRFEITSALRSAEDQASLRRTNVNAAQGVSTHEFGTTVDIAYFAFPPPAELPDGLVAEGPAWMEPYLHEIAGRRLESIANEKSRELQAVLGHILRAAQSEGLVMVTMERLQPVFHITVAKALADG